MKGAFEAWLQLYRKTVFETHTFQPARAKEGITMSHHMSAQDASRFGTVTGRLPPTLEIIITIYPSQIPIEAPVVKELTS